MKKIIISGEIGWDVWPGDVRRQLNAANGDDIEIHIGSPGGYIWDGLEIFNMIRDYKRDNPNSQIMIIIKGLAASMASYLAVNPSVDIVAAEDNAVFMIHNAGSCICGDYRDMQKASTFLEGLTDLLGKAYAEKSGKTPEEIKTMMNDESWFFGEEILKAGFIDEIIPTEKPKEKAISISKAKLDYGSLSVKMKEKADINDYQKAAALLPPVNNNIPAPRETQKEVIVMTLEELLKQNPGAKLEHEAALAEHKNAGIEEGKKQINDIVAVASKYLGSESGYPGTIQKLAIDTLAGKTSPDALETTVSAFDAFEESKKSKSAKDDNVVVGDTKNDPPTEVTEDGNIQTDADFSAEVVRTKAMLGR